MDLIKKDDSLHFRYITFPFFILYNELYKSKLSNNAKLLYALILDRLKLSIKNKFYNEKGEVFAYISRKEVQQILNCSDRTATKLFNELANLKLIYEDRKHIGQTTKIFVCSFGVVSDVVIELYAIFKECLKMEFSKKEIEIAYGKYCLKFTNVYEASLEFENLIHEAFEYYDNLGCIVNDTFKAQKNKLVRISSEVRTLKSKNLEDWRQCLQFLFNIFRVRS